MYTLRIEERSERRVSALVPRVAAGPSFSSSSPTAAATAEAAAAAAAGAPAPPVAAADAGDDGDPTTSAYDEVFRAPVPDGGAVEFSAGNPRVEHINGLVHLYRRTAPEEEEEEQGDQEGGGSARPKQTASATATTSPTVCCLAIPSDMAVASFCSFIGAYLEHARELRVLRREGLGSTGANGGNSGGNGNGDIGGNGGNGGKNGGNGNGGNGGGGGVCMVLVEFSEQAQADDFFADYNGRPFSALEPEILCRLVYVREVEVIEAGRRGQQQQQEQQEQKDKAQKGSGAGGKKEARGGKDETSVAVRPPASFLPAPPGHTELPSCPVCLERLDEHVTGGIVTTVCNHQFHSDCLQRWGDTSCPVCRYCAYGGRDAVAATSRCEVCGERGDTWMCLICGSTGCGRYRGGQHAVRHYAETGHSYALELETQRVWCYSADAFVHRLIMSKVDPRKLVELPSPAAASVGRGGGGGPGGVAGGGGAGGGGLAFGALPPPAAAARCGEAGGEAGGSSGAAGGGGDEGAGDGSYCGGPDGRPPHPAACAHHRRRRSQHYAAGAPSPRGGGGGGGRAGGGGGGGGEGHSGGGYGYGGGGEPCGTCPECRADEHVKEALVASKLDALSLEYTHLLTTQLESQRLYFESRLAAAESDAARSIARSGEEADAARRRAESSDAAAREGDRRRAVAERRAEQALAAARRAEEERGFLKTLNEALLQNAAAAKRREAERDALLRSSEAARRDLEEQVRDLMIALEARSVVERAGGGELHGATLLPVQRSELERRRAARDARNSSKGGGGGGGGGAAGGGGSKKGGGSG